jgi:hypothetical protein
MKKLRWVPNISLKIGLLHLWMGCDVSDGRRIFLLLEEIPNFQIQYKIHWLTDESPMFGISLYPVIVLHFFWMHSHDVSRP